MLVRLNHNSRIHDLFSIFMFYNTHEYSYTFVSEVKVVKLMLNGIQTSRILERNIDFNV